MKNLVCRWDSEVNMFVAKLSTTDIVRFNDNVIDLYTGGYLTKLTIKAINEVSQTNNLGFEVKKLHNNLSVSYLGKTVNWKNDKIRIWRQPSVNQFE